MGRADRSRGVLDSVNVAQMAGLHLSAAELDLAIVTHGSSGELRRHVHCPCLRIDTRSAAIDCEHCRGTGRLYPPAMRQPLIVLDLQRNATLKLVAAGRVPSGTVQLTFPSGVVPGDGDMWLPDEEVHVVEEVLYREGSSRVTDAILRDRRISPDQVKPALGARRERLLYPTPCCVEHVAYVDDEGKLIQANGAEYHVDGEGYWTWRVGGPSPGRAWSVRYRAPAAYLVHTSAPVYRVEADEPMPHRVIAQRLDRLSHQDLDT